MGIVPAAFPVWLAFGAVLVAAVSALQTAQIVLLRPRRPPRWSGIVPPAAWRRHWQAIAGCASILVVGGLATTAVSVTLGTALAAVGWLGLLMLANAVWFDHAWRRWGRPAGHANEV